MNKKWSVLAICAAMYGANLSAQEQHSEWQFGGRVGTLSIDSDSAQQEGIDDTAYLVGGYVDYIQNGWVTSINLDIAVYDDNEEFEQLVEGDGVFNDGDRSYESSDASAVLISIATGYQWSFGEDDSVSTRAQAGFTAVVASERSISFCSDCFSEDIDIDGGAFVKASLEKDTGPVTIGLYYQQFLASDGLSNSFGLNISGGF